MKFVLKEPMLVSARVEGNKGTVRELSCVLDFNSPYCTILGVDAITLGFPHAANPPQDEERVRPGNVTRFTEMRGIERGIKVRLPKVSIGNLVARDVDAVVLELEHPRHITFDFVLGRTFLKNFKLTVDVGKGYLSIVQA